jgi:hypothetical protein
MFSLFFVDLKNIYGFSKYILNFLNIVLLTDAVLKRQGSHEKSSSRSVFTVTFLPALVHTYNAGLTFPLLLFFLLGSQTLLKIQHYCPISPCIQHCIAALLGKYYIITLLYIQKYFEFRLISTGFGLRAMHSEIFRVSTNFDQIWITCARTAVAGPNSMRVL